MPGFDVSMVIPLGIYQSEKSNAQEFQKASKLACWRPGSFLMKGGEAGEIGRVLFALTRKITGIVLGSGERNLHRDCGLILARNYIFFRKVRDAVKVRGWVCSTKIGLQSLLA